MNLTLNRHPSGRTCTIGDLLLDGEFFCHTLEDVVRSAKVAGETAIPSGVYQVRITPSVRFKRDLPLVMNVPGFDGIRIHAGITDADTAGCILVGDWNGGETISGSRAKLDALMAILVNATVINLEICGAEE